jgi:ATP-dependent exoDNAse (exonuclease V) alpha subunit
MCTSGARLQLAIAPAGARKTTAMRALTLAWAEDGGQVIGLAPSAAAAAVLAEQTGIRTDTLAKLTWSLRNGDLPDWATGVGPATLIIIDEAGMADTLSLDTAVRFAIDHGASVRLIGDDQQLAAIGAGGVLRDIKNMHGALHLTELHRFTVPAETQASLALREGDPSALGFYLDHGRVHVGDLAKITEDAFAAWVQDRSAGLDAIMLAPTREMVADLNRRAREHRRDRAAAGQEVRLGDGNRASVGDMIITRTNDRRLQLSATDWVKNGDRWTITHINRSGGLTVRHSRSQLNCQLPADYVTTSTGLGYATTIHGAQGVSADTMHGLVTGQESRPQLYTTLTRGRHANHLYLQVVGDGDPTPSSDPTPSHRAHQPRRCSRSSRATTRPSPPAPCYASSTTQPPASSRLCSATPMASTWQPNNFSGHEPWPNLTASTNTCPASLTNPPGQPSGLT